MRWPDPEMEVGLLTATRYRLDLHHEILLQLMDGELHFAPLRVPHRILDIGTGTGIWAIDMADKYPSAEVLGVDLRCVYLLADQQFLQPEILGGLTGCGD